MPIEHAMEYLIRSAGEDLADVRYDRVDRLAFALAIFGAECTLRHVAGAGTVTLLDRSGRELLSYHGERLAVERGPYLER